MLVATQKILLFLFVLGQRIGETPSKMDRVVSIELIDLHCKMLPGKLMRCRALRTLDISGDQLTELPLNIGDLQNLAELALCENQQVPSSFGGQLKRMKVLKAAKKNSTVQPPAMCSRALLTNLIMCDNELKQQLQQEIPSRIGNLRRLRFLDLNVNNLHSFPPTIGGCQSLAILSLRHNNLSELPMEIGKLNKPLVCAQDLEKLKEAAEQEAAMRRRAAAANITTTGSSTSNTTTTSNGKMIPRINFFVHMLVATQKILLFLFVIAQRIGETPSKMDRVVSIELIDLHCKMLPGKLMRCRALRTLDISGDQLTELPMRNDLQNLANLALCENQQVPSSFGGNTDNNNGNTDNNIGNTDNNNGNTENNIGNTDNNNGTTENNIGTTKIR
ncbi:hypothetical protein niasHT_008434 [Heterodera trifolii]|uniref:Uncharacterized protein n=1 Tax=Heterodera trifolii TaxID=157864 RepID=A0ABD2M5L9_9BILA